MVQIYKKTKKIKEILNYTDLLGKIIGQQEAYKLKRERKGYGYGRNEKG